METPEERRIRKRDAQRKRRATRPDEVEKGRAYAREYARKRRIEYPDRIRVSQANYDVQVQEKMATDPVFRAEMQRFRREKSARYCAEHPEWCAEQRRKTVQRRRERLAASPPLRIRQSVYSANWRALRKFHAPGVLDWEEVVQLAESCGYACAYCGKTPTTFLDHVIPFTRSGTNVLENIVLCCAACNSRKNNQLLSEWVVGRPAALAREIVTRHQLTSLK